MNQVKDNLLSESKSTSSIVMFEVLFQSAVIMNAIADMIILSDTFAEKFVTTANEFFKVQIIPDIAKHEIVLKKLSADSQLELQNEIAETLSEVYSSTFANIFENGVSSQVLRTLNITVNRCLDKFVSNKLGMKSTVDDLHAGANANYLTIMPLNNKQELHTVVGATVTDRIEYAEKISSPAEPGSLLECRVIAQLEGRDILIYDVSPSGKLQKRAYIKQDKTDQHQIVLHYHQPTEQNKIGHYEAKIEGNIVKFDATEGNCLFYALAQAKNTELVGADLHNAALQLRAQCANELKNNSYWEPFVQRRLALDSHKGYAAVGGARDDNAPKRVLTGNYPHGDQFEVLQGDKEHMNALNELKGKLDKMYDKNDKFENTDARKRGAIVDATDSEPRVTFGENAAWASADGAELKRNFMLGTLEVELVKGTEKKTIKLMAMSGDRELNFRGKKFNFETKNGFRLINSGMPEGPIGDLSGKSQHYGTPTPSWDSIAVNGRAKSCAAKKLMAGAHRFVNILSFLIHNF